MTRRKPLFRPSRRSFLAGTGAAAAGLIDHHDGDIQFAGLFNAALDHPADEGV